jgi:hypothetical protein
MNDTYIDLYSPEFWEGIRTRLQPYLGDLTSLLGDRWMDVFQHAFSRADFLAVTASAWNAGRVRSWIEIDLPHSGLSEYVIGRYHDCVARHMDVALAWLSLRCKEAGFWPDAISGEESSVVLSKGGQIIARLRALELTRSSESDRQRALSTVSGLRKHEQAAGEFAKRVRRWPGLKDMSFAEPPRTFAHFPVPSEWLISARELCQHAKVSEPSTDLLQRIAAAVFSAPSWNHLVAHQDIELAAAYCPWEVRDGDKRIAAFADPFQGFAFLAHRIPDWAFGKSNVRCDLLNRDDQDLPTVGLRAPADHALQYEQRWDREQRLTLNALMPATLEDEAQFALRADIATALATGGVSALGRYFGLSGGAAERLAARDDYNGENLVAEDGPYRITANDTHLWIRRHAADGTCLWEAAIARHRGAVWKHPSGLLVMSGEYHLDKPVGVLPMLAPWTMEGISAALAKSVDQFAATRFDRETYYTWRGTAADRAIHDAAQALARGEAVDFGKIDLTRQALAHVNA